MMICQKVDGPSLKPIAPAAALGGPYSDQAGGGCAPYHREAACALRGRWVQAAMDLRANTRYRLSACGAKDKNAARIT